MSADEDTFDVIEVTPEMVTNIRISLGPGFRVATLEQIWRACEQFIPNFDRIPRLLAAALVEGVHQNLQNTPVLH